jgi:hypothetical protein
MMPLLLARRWLLTGGAALRTWQPIIDKVGMATPK